MVKKIFEKYIKTVWADPERKSVIQIISEAIRFSVAKKVSPTAYFTRLLYKKDRHNYMDYLGNTMVSHLQKHLNDPTFIPILENKYLYHLFFKEYGLPIPNSIAYNVGKFFFVGKERQVVDSMEDFVKLLHKIYERCEKNKVLFMKELAGAWGKGAHKIEKNDLENGKVSIEALYRDIVSANFIIQEAIAQHALIDRLYPLSINSIRIDTYMDKSGKVEILSALLRMGGNGNFVDNVTAGGLFVGINTQKGELNKKASVFLKNGAKSYYKHPDTAIIFENYEIPFFKEAKELAIKAAEALPSLRLVGWDIVISEQGPLLLEGNHLYHIGMSEMAYGGYYRNPVFRKILEEMNIFTGKSERT